jgi:NAD(P)-dependent dehydrogenase (short-subunit alcohol dehydrogenase family)
MDIVGKVAVVTGAGSGIGRATARALARSGAAVVVGDIDEAAGEETVAQIVAEGGTATFVRCDVSDARSVEALFAAAVDAYGGIDIVHNNAGVVSGEPIWPAITPETLTRVIAVNLGGPVLGTRLAIDHLRARGGGVIVNTASLAAQFPLAEDPVYSATKAGVAMFTRACASLADEGIRVNAVLPGLVDTPLLHKAGDGTRPPEWVERSRPVTGTLAPDDVAEAVLDLIRDDGAVAEERIVLAKAIEAR